MSLPSAVTPRGVRWVILALPLALLLASAPAVLTSAVSSKMLVHTPRFKEHTENGVLLWSWGRCGTGTFWDSLRETIAASGMQMRSICDRKEGVSYSHLTPTHVDE